MRKTWWIGGSALALAGVVVSMLSGRAVVQAAAGPDAPRAAQAASSPMLEFRAHEVVSPSTTRMPRTLQFSGPLVAPNTAIVRAKAAGTLLSLAVVEGSRVAAGQRLGRIDLAELSQRVAERDANLDAARAALAQAERSHLNNERLAAQSFISPSALDGSRAQLDGARAAMAAAQAARDSARIGLGDAAPVAPIAGIVARRHVLPGEKVALEQALLTIVDLHALELAGSVGTHEVASLQAGMPVQVRVEGVEQPVQGRLVRIAPAAETGTRSIGVTVGIANADERLRAGQYALASVELPDERQRLALPAAAVMVEGGQGHVWVVEGGALARRAVTTGRTDLARGQVEILTGVVSGTQVLGARFDNLREGAAARVLADEEGRAPGLPAQTTVSSALRRP